MKDLEETLKSLYMDKEKSIITEEQFIHLSRGFTQDMDKYQQLLNHLSAEKESLLEKQEKQENQQSLPEMIWKYKKLNGLTRDMVAELIDVIYIGSCDKQTGEQRIKIVWNL